MANSRKLLKKNTQYLMNTLYIKVYASERLTMCRIILLIDLYYAMLHSCDDNMQCYLETNKLQRSENRV